MLHYLTMCQKIGTPTASAASYSAYYYNCTCSATYAYICTSSATYAYICKSSATYAYICKSSATYAYIYKCSAIFYDYIFTSAGITSAQVQLSLVHVWCYNRYFGILQKNTNYRNHTANVSNRHWQE